MWPFAQSSIVLPTVDYICEYMQTVKCSDEGEDSSRMKQEWGEEKKEKQQRQYGDKEK